MVEKLGVRRGEENLLPIHESGETAGSKKNRFEKGQKGSDVPIRKELAHPIQTYFMNEGDEISEEEKRLNESGYKKPFKKPTDVSVEEYEEFFKTKDTPEELVEKFNEQDDQVLEMTPDEAYEKLVSDENKQYDLERYNEENPIKIIQTQGAVHALSGENLPLEKKQSLWERVFGLKRKKSKTDIDQNLLEIPKDKINSQLGRSLKEEHNLEVGFSGTAGKKADDFFERNNKSPQDQDEKDKEVYFGVRKIVRSRKSKQAHQTKARPTMHPIQSKKEMRKNLEQGYVEMEEQKSEDAGELEVEE